MDLIQKLQVSKARFISLIEQVQEEYEALEELTDEYNESPEGEEKQKAAVELSQILKLFSDAAKHGSPESDSGA